MTRKFGLSKHRSARTFIDFSLQCKLEPEDWCVAKIKMYWDSPKRISASESLLWALTRDLLQFFTHGQSLAPPCSQQTPILPLLSQPSPSEESPCASLTVCCKNSWNVSSSLFNCFTLFSKFALKRPFVLLSLADGLEVGNKHLGYLQTLIQCSNFGRGTLGVLETAEVDRLMKHIVEKKNYIKLSIFQCSFCLIFTMIKNQYMIKLVSIYYARKDLC